jgi:hypothetical protein
MREPIAIGVLRFALVCRGLLGRLTNRPDCARPWFRPPEREVRRKRSRSARYGRSRKPAVLTRWTMHSGATGNGDSFGSITAWLQAATDADGADPIITGTPLRGLSHDRQSHPHNGARHNPASCNP